MKEKNYLYVLDYSTPSIVCIEMETQDTVDMEALLKKYNLNIDECSYMWATNKLEIEYETED